MKIGFTGTRVGMTSAQLKSFAKMMAFLLHTDDDFPGLIPDLDKAPFPTEFHHGDCVGSDDQAATIVYELFPDLNIIKHPPANNRFWANNPHYHAFRDPAHNFKRDQNIVNEADLLIATPRTAVEIDNGGTWYTVRFARRKHQEGGVKYGVWLITPEGVIKRNDVTPLRPSMTRQTHPSKEKKL
jgi:hypothetical protein